MAVGEARLFGKIFQEVEESETIAAQHGSVRPSELPDELARRQHELDYEKASFEKSESVRRALDELTALTDEQLPPGRKHIALAIMGSRMRVSVKERELIVNEAFEIYDRITKFFDGPDQIVFNGGDGEVGLYRSSGIENLIPGEIEPMMRRLGIRAVFAGGVRVSVNTPEEESFPEIDIEPGHTLGLDVFDGVTNYSNPLESLKAWDPVHSRIRPIVYLGRPGVMPPLQITSELSESEKFAFRIAAHMLGEADWLKGYAPSEDFKSRVEGSFATIFADVLMGDAPRDKVVHTSGKFSKMTDRTRVENYTQRGNGLAEFSVDELRAILYGADVSHEALMLATKQKIADARSTSTAKTIYATIQAKRDFDEFFYSLLLEQLPRTPVTLE